MEGDGLKGTKVRLIVSTRKLKMDEAIKCYKIRSPLVVQVFIIIKG